MGFFSDLFSTFSTSKPPAGQRRPVKQQPNPSGAEPPAYEASKEKKPFGTMGQNEQKAAKRK